MITTRGLYVLVGLAVLVLILNALYAGDVPSECP